MKQVFQARVSSKCISSEARCIPSEASQWVSSDGKSSDGQGLRQGFKARARVSTNFNG
jgi:hypothetical protein